MAEARARNQGLEILEPGDYATQALALFREREWLPERPVNFPGKREFKRLALDPSGKRWIRIHEVEHWTEVSSHAGLPKNWDGDPILGSDENWETLAPFGTLTSQPEFAGLGLRFEVLLHLPALTALGKMQSALQAADALGCRLQPWSPQRGGGWEAGYARLCSIGGMNFSIEDHWSQFRTKVERFLAVEMEAMEFWTRQRKPQLEDRVARAAEMLKAARRLGYAEGLSLAAHVRIGTYMGILPETWLNRMEDARVRTQPGHLSAMMGMPMELEEEDSFRAKVVKSLLSES
jgi:hypothetical protein